jgi:YVTN family beta-propeller protein
MLPPSPSLKRFRKIFAVTLSLALAASWLAWGRGMHGASAQNFSSDPAPAANIVKNFESPQVHPLALTPDGARLLAVNSPNGTLSVFQLASGSPVLSAEIPVGLEPVSVAARNNREAWVVNWLSDSVSIVDLSTGNVTRTIDVGDEPTDVLFAGSQREMAFVCVSGGGQQNIGFTQITGGSGVVKVLDPNNPTAPAQTITIFGKQPRSLASSADRSRVFVSVFESGNQTTIVPEDKVRPSNGGLGLPAPNPPLKPGLPASPNTGLIVKWNGSQWVDELNRSWNSAIPYTLADIDLGVITASGSSLPSSLSAQVRGIGTHVGNMAFDPVAQRLLVANLEDINQVRFEPNLSGRFQSSRVSVLNASTGTPPTLASVSDLNSHVNFANPAGTDAERAQSLALPADITRSADGTVYVAATSSNRVGVLSSDGAVQTRVGVGQGPTGLAVDEARQRLYVLNRFDETLSIVDTVSKSQTAVVPVGFNPEPQTVRDGRRFLYDATSFSAHGTVSCASCHLNGHRDGMVWDLGNPQGSVDNVSVFFPAGFFNGNPPAQTGSDSLHPMKGPMMTQSFRSIIGNEPFHWRGDRAGIENFNGAFTSLLGGPRLLSTEEMAAFKEFVRSLAYPPNPNEFQNRPPVEQSGGFGFFSSFPLDGNIVSCNQCHLVTNFRSGTDNKITPSQALMATQSVKVPQLRGLYQKIGMDKSPGEKITGFGFSHDGTFDTLFNFQKAAPFNFSSAGDPGTADSWRLSMEQMILQLDTGTPPAVGLMVTVDATNKNTFNVTNRIALLQQQTAAGNCELVVRGIFAGNPRSFLRVSNNTFQPDSLSEAPVSLQTLLNAAGTGAELTFIGVPVGEGRMRSIDRDGNNILNDDEPRTSVSITGRAVNAAGAGLAGVTVTLSGSQAATTVTDAQGKFTFNFVSTTGTHTVTPQGTGVTFSPLSRTFSAPSWNQSATFITSPTVNAADASQFFVAQHYADFLNREPDTPGLNFWTGEIEGCGADAACREVKRINVSAAFFLSIEFQQTGFLVYRVFKASFGDIAADKPVPVTFSQLMTDTQRIGRGVIVTPPPDNAWQTLLESNKVAFFTGWVQRPDFLANYPAGMSADAFVDKLNANTGGSLTQAERSALIGQLAQNTTAQRASVVRQVAENSEFSRREVNKAFVLMQYVGYLRRNPNDAPQPNLDFSGYNFWLGKLNEHNGNFVQAEMVKSFIISGEYRERFGQ